MKGMDGGGPAHRRLMIRLSKRVPVRIPNYFQFQFQAHYNSE